MTLFGVPIEKIYLTMLLIAGIIIVLYIFFGDVLEVIGESASILNPVLILAFIIFFSATGYIFEWINFFSSGINMIIAFVIALLLDTLLHVFVLLPMASAEQSLTYSENSLIGRVGKIIISIPEDGYGEIFIESKSGMISKPAACIEKTPINEGEKVLVLEIKDGVLYVTPYQHEQHTTMDNM